MGVSGELQGTPGADGADGSDGTDGKTWYGGATAPAAGLGVVGDWYLNTTTQDVYEKTGVSTWTVRVNIKGEQGIQGIPGQDTTYANATTSVDGLMSKDDKTKLDGVAANADVSVNSDWNASSGKAQILNKPSIPTVAGDVGLSNVDNVKQMPISGGVLENYREKLVTLSGTSTTINLSLGNVFTHTLSGNTTYSITNAVNSQAHSFTLIINTGSAVRTLIFPCKCKMARWRDARYEYC